MALFPISPSIGDSVDIGGSAFEWDGIKWLKVSSSIAGGGSSSIAAGDTPPQGPQLGDVWFNTTNLELYIYYSDGDSSQWVQATSDSVIIDELSQDILPSQDREYNVGSADLKWATGYFNQIFVGEREISGSTTSAAAGVINTSAELPNDAPIGQLYVITQEQAVKVWLGSSWVNLIDGAVPVIDTIVTQTGELFDGESDTIFIINGSNFVSNAAGNPVVKVITQDGSTLTANYNQYISTEQIRFSFFRTFTVDEGPLTVVVENPNGLSATKVSAIQTGNKRQWVGPTKVFSVLTESPVNVSIRSNSFISDDNAIADFTFNVYEDITYTTIKTDRVVAPGLTLSEVGIVSGTAPTITTDATYNMFIGIVDGLENETKVNLTFDVISSQALPTAQDSFLPSLRPSTQSFLGNTLTDWTVIEAPYQNSTMLSTMNQLIPQGYTSGGRLEVPTQRNGETSFFENKVVRFMSLDANNQVAIISFEDLSSDASYDLNAGYIGGITLPASTFNNTKSVCMWGYNSEQGWVPLWLFPSDGQESLSSDVTMTDGGEVEHAGWRNSGNRGINIRRLVTTSTPSQNLTRRTVSNPPSSNTGIVGYGSTNGFRRLESPSDINKSYFTSAKLTVYAAAGNLAASNEYIYIYTYGSTGSGNGDSYSVRTGLNSGNMLPVNYVYNINDLQEPAGLTFKSFYMNYSASSGITYSPTQILSSSVSSKNNLVNQYHWGFWYYVDWFYTVPGSTSTSYVTGYVTSYGIGKQAAFDTMPLEYIGFSTYS